jgi:hypothetical protein
MSGTKGEKMRRIGELKCEIQDLIDKGAKDNTEEKETKMAQLKELTVELKKEQKRRATKKEIFETGRKIDSLEFHVAKKKGGFAVDAAKEKKEAREHAKKQFFELMEIESEYDKRDSSKYPGRLFLHKSIIEKYGMCPYIDANETCEQNREAWLQSQQDSGQLYSELYNRLVLHQDLQGLLCSIEGIESDILSFITSCINATEKESFNEIYAFFREYSGQSVKTKRIKDRHKHYINMLSVLQTCCHLPLHEFLSAKFDTHVFVNEMQGNQVGIEKNRAQILYLQTEFEEKLTMYKKRKDEHLTSSKYVTNTVRNLKNELYKYLSKTMQVSDELQVAKSGQEGKYFKKWTLLTHEEKVERFETFAKYYVENNTINNPRNKTINKTLEHSGTLANLLKDAYTKKDIVYRDLSWDVKRGVIHTVKNLGYNERKDQFYIVPTVKPCSAPKRSVLDADGQKVANEAILEYIVKKYKSGHDQEVKKDIDLSACIEILKTKLDLKKLSKVQNQQVAEIYNDMIDIITDKSLDL